MLDPILALCLLYDAPSSDGSLNSYGQDAYEKARSAARDVLKEHGLLDYFKRREYVRKASP